MMPVQGIILRPRFSRGGHTFEVPILLSPTVTDYKLLLAAYVVPPLAVFVTKYYVIKPLRMRAKVRKVGVLTHLKRATWLS